MNNGTNAVCKESQKFIRQLFKAYFEDGNFELLKSVLHENVTWYGTKKCVICSDAKGVCSLLDNEKASWNNHFKITKQYYNTLPLNENFCVVSGEISLIEDGLENILLKIQMRFSVVCELCDGEIKLYHAHFSLLNSSESDSNYTHDLLENSCNEKLVKKLQERTNMLIDKTNELEALTNNIMGGLQVCEFDDAFTMSYVSDGFLNLVGYFRDELETLFQNKHVALIYPPDLNNMKKNMYMQLEGSESFSLEYRIVKKDGSLVWVLDKGNIVLDHDKKTRVQCILTDITDQKMQEEELNINKQRYEIALQQLDVTMFEYDIIKKELLFFDDIAEMYQVPRVVPNGPQTFVEKGIVNKKNADSYLAMYKKIHAGAACASCFITSRDANGENHDYELTLTSIFDLKGNPVRAIGIRKNVSQILLLEREKEFAKTLTADKNFICEIDVTNKKIVYINEIWIDKLNIANNASLFDILEFVKDTLIAPEYQDLFGEKTSPSNIIKEYEKGNSVLIFEYLRNTDTGKYSWSKATVNIIKDARSGIISIRYYTTDITEQKAKEQQELEEKLLYKNMVSKAKLAYEANLSKNIAIRGHEHWYNVFGIKQSSDYEKMIDAFAKHAVYSEDVPTFTQSFDRKYILHSFDLGERQVVCHYRRPNAASEYIWLKCTMHLYEDPTSKDVKGYAYVEDIDKQKREELELKYKAEHDAMTNLYNKDNMERIVSSLLKVDDIPNQLHAFFIIDIDYFKNLNDTLGHMYGDKVLIEIADRLRSLFRKEDVLGRVGGDEFAVFIKNIDSKEVASRKADEICQKLVMVYEEKNGTCSISASVGIAIYTTNGTSYKDLYKYADSALYAAKRNGRNQYHM